MFCLYILHQEYVCITIAVAQLLRTAYGTNGALTRYLKLWIAHVPEIPGTFSPSVRVSDPDMREARVVMHVRIAN